MAIKSTMQFPHASSQSQKSKLYKSRPAKAQMNRTKFRFHTSEANRSVSGTFQYVRTSRWENRQSNQRLIFQATSENSLTTKLCVRIRFIIHLTHSRTWPCTCTASGACGQINAHVCRADCIFMHLIGFYYTFHTGVINMRRTNAIRTRERIRSILWKKNGFFFRTFHVLRFRISFR